MNKAPIKVFSMQIDFINVFSPKLSIKFSEYTKINNNVNELVDD